MSNLPRKPPDVFDRELEWRHLAAFAADTSPELLLGLVWGRRRQGKSFLLHALAEATGGFYYEAVEGTGADLLADLGAKLAEHSGAPAPLRFGSWEMALEALAALRSARGGAVVVLDELPYLAAAEPRLPSLLQRLLAARGPSRRDSRVRLLLCGSAVRFMRGLLGGTAPLRGRAGLEQVIRPFDHRQARRFWGLDDLPLAVMTYAVVGGTPAYRREFVRGDAPRSRRDFDSWIERAVLDPSSPLFREGRTLVTEEPTVTDAGLYHSVLGAIAAGENAPSRVAGRVGRPLNALAHVLGVLSDAGLVDKHVDPFHANRTTYEITEPLVAFHHAIMRPSWAELERGGARRLWSRARPTFLAKLVGPTFERICREWTAGDAALRVFGGPVSSVGRGRRPDPAARDAHEVDVVALDGKRVRVLGEAKWGKQLGPASVERLERLRALAEKRGLDTTECRLALFSGRGFSPDLRRRPGADVVLVDLDRLYD